MNYNLASLSASQKKQSTLSGLASLLKLIAHERKNLVLAIGIILLNSALSLVSPLMIGYAIDRYVAVKNFHGVLVFAGILILMYVLALFTSYFQTILMGGVGQRLLFTLRNSIFNKLQELPVAFFNANRSGDLISRVNNDTDKLNIFFSQSLMQFVGSIVTMVGSGLFLLFINPKLGLATLLPALIIFVFTKVLSPWVKKKNALNLASVGGLSGEIQESLANFKVIVAFNRRDYFRQRFAVANERNYSTAVSAGLVNNIFLPVYTMLSGLAQLLVLLYGIHLIAAGEFTVGLLVSYFAYATYFYNPLRQLATLWSSFQVAMAGWDRIAVILALDNRPQLPLSTPIDADPSKLIQLSGVRFSYDGQHEILHNVNLSLDKGKRYAFVGPTGGGKTTTASLIARLYDPTEGSIYLHGRDIRSYSNEERAAKIGFILQEPILFSGTVRENILYGNAALANLSQAQLEAAIGEANLSELLAMFENGLDTKVSSSSDGMSLGQKQIIAFMRAVLRQPEVLILDEATANIDTVTEQLLESILKKLPPSTTRITIAHRLNTIANADEIYFVNSGEVTRAGSLQDAVDQLLKGRRTS